MLREGEKREPAQGHEWDRLGEYDKVAGIGNELEGEGRTEIAVEEEWIMPNFWFSSA